MVTTSIDKAGARLHRVLGTWDLVLFNIAAIVALRWLSIAAQVGPSSLVLWLLGLVGFFVPLALAVLEGRFKDGDTVVVKPGANGELVLVDRA